jgi:hypothetical protein
MRGEKDYLKKMRGLKATGFSLQSFSKAAQQYVSGDTHGIST